jgi:hypothetical protein
VTRLRGRAERALKHDGPAYEFYLGVPQTTPPGRLRTRVVLPVR